MSDNNNAIKALSERLDEAMESFDEVVEGIYEDIGNLFDQVKELQTNMTSVISMFTQMNISLLQIQNDTLSKEDK